MNNLDNFIDIRVIAYLPYVQRCVLQKRTHPKYLSVSFSTLRRKSRRVYRGHVSELLRKVTHVHFTPDAGFEGGRNPFVQDIVPVNVLRENNEIVLGFDIDIASYRLI